MKVVILAGGQGTRLAEETDLRPKPMVEIGQRPILWHIMKHYAHHGFDEFVVALGYRGEDIKRFFLDHLSLSGDMTIRLGERTVDQLHPEPDQWTVHLVDTGLDTNTGGRVGRLASWLGDAPFMLTYGDGVSDVDLPALLEHHRASGKLATVTAVRPASRFGGLDFRDDGQVRFIEKPQISEGWVSGGFMVLEPEVLAYVEGDRSSFESNVLERISEEGRLGAFRHEGFWQSMDTIRDVRYLRGLWSEGNAPWRTWE
ncbi:MAG TPA: glucose-1-phosphate cytidylyltransferase [Candidatus Limnocylindrales bacterium]|nr:glucose-1-phosphate cytidylyltransferase [Candidatus Limnocylindrales bacterium]